MIKATRRSVSVSRLSERHCDSPQIASDETGAVQFRIGGSPERGVWWAHPREDGAPGAIRPLPDDLVRKAVVNGLADREQPVDEGAAPADVLFPKEFPLAFQNCGTFDQDFWMVVEPAQKREGIRRAVPQDLVASRLPVAELGVRA